LPFTSLNLVTQISAWPDGVGVVVTVGVMVGVPVVVGVAVTLGVGVHLPNCCASKIARTSCAERLRAKIWSSSSAASRNCPPKRCAPMRSTAPLLRVPGRSVASPASPTCAPSR
jgi:hypothetical protein